MENMNRRNFITKLVGVALTIVGAKVVGGKEVNQYPIPGTVDENGVWISDTDRRDGKRSSLATPAVRESELPWLKSTKENLEALMRDESRPIIRYTIKVYKPPNEYARCKVEYRDGTTAEWSKYPHE